MKRVLVTGAAGFIGGHLVHTLKGRGEWVRGIDIKPIEYGTEYSRRLPDDFMLADLRDYPRALEAMIGIDEVYALAADMGGMGHIGNHNADLFYNNATININTLHAAHKHGVSKYLYTSSACVYPEYRQMETDSAALKETDAYPAEPDLEYGWEKLFTERLVNNYSKDYAMQVRVVRFHNVYGEFGTWSGGREKVPAALCRKVAMAKLFRHKHIEVWGDGEQTRSFLHIMDCIDGINRLMESDYNKPINLGSDEQISINNLAKLIMRIAGVDLEIRHDLTKPQGVRGRNSDNTKLKEVLNWQPELSLESGLRYTYGWIESQVRNSLDKIPHFQDGGAITRGESV